MPLGAGTDPRDERGMTSGDERGDDERHWRTTRLIDCGYKAGSPAYRVGNADKSLRMVSRDGAACAWISLMCSRIVGSAALIDP